MAIPKFQAIVDELDLTVAEREFVEDAETYVTQEMTAARVLADIYLGKKIEVAGHRVQGSTDGLQIAVKKSTEKVIESNRKLAAANRKYALGLNILTFALVLVTLAQVLLPSVR